MIKEIFSTVKIMKNLEGFKELNSLFLKKNGKQISIEGETKTPFGEIVLLKNKANLNDITNFIWEGEFLLKKNKGFVIKREVMERYKFKIDTENETYSFQPKIKDEIKVLASLINLYLTSLRNFALSVKGENK